MVSVAVASAPFVGGKRKVEPEPVEAADAQPFGNGNELFIGVAGKVIVVERVAWLVTTLDVMGAIGAVPFCCATISARIARRRASIA